MFKTLRKKFKVSITLIIMIIVTIPLISLFSSFKISLERDYDKNSEKFHNQICQIFKMKITHIEDSVNMYIFKYQLGKVLENPTQYAFSNNELVNISSYCPDISHICILDKNFKTKYMNNKVLSDSFNSVTQNDVYSFFSDKTHWFSFYLDKKYNMKKLFWVYTCPISSTNGCVIGYAAAFIENDAFADFFSRFNTDYCYSDSFYLCSNQSNDTVLSEILSKLPNCDKKSVEKVVLSGGHTSIGKKKIHSYNLKSKELRFVSVSKNEYVTSILRKFLLMLITAWFILLCLSLFISSKITNQFIGDLQNLCKKVNRYTKSKENSEEQQND